MGDKLWQKCYIGSTKAKVSTLVAQSRCRFQPTTT